jgi:hypothetical protein
MNFASTPPSGSVKFDKISQDLNLSLNLENGFCNQSREQFHDIYHAPSAISEAKLAHFLESIEDPVVNLQTPQKT